MSMDKVEQVSGLGGSSPDFVEIMMGEAAAPYGAAATGGFLGLIVGIGQMAKHYAPNFSTHTQDIALQNTIDSLTSQKSNGVLKQVGASMPKVDATIKHAEQQLASNRQHEPQAWSNQAEAGALFGSILVGTLAGYSIYRFAKKGLQTSRSHRQHTQERLQATMDDLAESLVHPDRTWK